MAATATGATSRTATSRPRATGSRCHPGRRTGTGADHGGRNVPGGSMVAALLACGGIVVVAEPLMIALLRRLAVIDVPGGRSSHTVPTPRGGGLPIAVGLLVAAALASRAGGPRAVPVPGAPGG